MIMFGCIIGWFVDGLANGFGVPEAFENEFL
jgi:hypothetical protein